VAQPPFEPGGPFDAGYRIERELGRGGMATVWLAHDRKHDRPVALKVLRPEVAAALGPERFQREIKLAARLQHPHILSVYDSGAAPGRGPGPAGDVLWYTMPYVEGESLRERLRRSGRLPVGEAVRIAREVAQALQYAHDHGVVHRDIKPENILLTADGNTLVADFGIARPLDEPGPALTATGLVLGTPSYMSPEQATGQTALDGRSDVYSLGCVLYEMLSGGPPFTGPTVAAVLGKQITQPAPPLPADAAPQPVARAVARALAKSPAERYASAAEFAAALAPAERPPSTGRRGLRRALPLALAGLGLLGLTYYGGTRLLRAGSAAGTGAVASGFNRKLAQLTFGEGVEESPAWSPDGRTLAYVGEAEGYKQIFLLTLPSGPERRLTRGPKDDIQPAWSSDAKRLAFVRAKTDRGKLEPSDINGWYSEGGDIWTLDLESGRQQKLVPDAFHPAYSPDGTRLAFDAPWAGPRRIWIADAGGRNPRQVTSDSSEAVVHTEPRWSPDGRTLVFRRIEKTKSDIVVVDPATSRMIRLTHDNVQDLDPVWSPDGRYVYFASYRGGGLNLWRLAVTPGGEAAGSPEQLTTGAGDDVEPSLAPDGRRLAFAVRGINSDLWRLPVSPETGRPTGGPEPVLATSRVESRGSWSPDGRTIAFNSDRLGEMNLWLRNLADGTERRLTTGPGGDYQPEWSPDGRSLVFFSARSGNADLWTVRVADGRLTRLTDSPGMDINPFYSPDGRRIAFLSDRTGRTEVWVMNPDGSEQRQLTSVGAGGHFLLWTPDGRGVIFRAETGTEMRIYRAAVPDGALTRLPDVASGAHMTFSPDRSRILDVRGHKSLWIYPLQGGEPYQIFEFPDPDVRVDYPVWSPDGRWVLFDRAASRGGDLWLLEGLESPYPAGQKRWVSSR
jgi:serine/threonine-protein kinase